MPVITAKFASTCPKCKTPIAVGSRVNWERGQRAEHVTCPAQGSIKTYEVEMAGPVLQERLAGFQSRLETLSAMVADEVLTVVGEPPAVCPFCKGKGVLSASVNCSNTSDCSDWQTFAGTCPRKSTAVTTPWQGDINGGPALRFDGVEPTSQAPNAACVAEAEGLNRYESDKSHTNMEVEARRPEILFLRNMVRLTREELTIRRGDVATVINRNKPRTGVVTWIGAGEPVRSFWGRFVEGPNRVQVDVAGDKRYGGPEATAVLVRRTQTFNLTGTEPV